MDSMKFEDWILQLPFHTSQKVFQEATKPGSAKTKKRGRGGTTMHKWLNNGEHALQLAILTTQQFLGNDKLQMVNSRWSGSKAICSTLQWEAKKKKKKKNHNCPLFLKNVTKLLFFKLKYTHQPHKTCLYNKISVLSTTMIENSLAVYHGKWMTSSWKWN